MATGYLRGEYESTPGNEVNTPTLSTKTIYLPLISFTPGLNPSPMERDDELRNQDEPLPVLEEMHAPTWDLDTRMYPDTVGFLLKGLLGAPTTTTGNGVITDPDAAVVPTGAYKHVWTAPFGPSGASPQTTQWQASYSDQSAYFKLKGAATESFSIESPESGGAMVKAAGPALYMVRQSNPSLTPSYESLSIRPFTRQNLTVSWLSGTGTVEDFSVSCANPVEMVRSLGVASKFPDVMEKGEGVIAWTGSIPHRQLDADDYDALKGATGFSATAKWISDSIIASSYPYKLYIAFSNAQYTGGGPNALSNNRRIGASFDFKATYAGSASVTVTLVNATSSYL